MIEVGMPCGAEHIINKLVSFGYKAYLVGGCVRDALMGRAPNDWDICTDAKPERIIDCFGEKNVIKTGVKHGTVTLKTEDGLYEVTTFRTDGKYKDNRHPDSVRFVTDIREDLSRRDFTVNAVAYNVSEGFVDPFGGVRDIENGIIRCVGNARERFDEDALRIMRALRFSSVLGFSAEPHTRAAIHEQKALLKNVSNERISAELCKMITGKDVYDVFTEYADVIQIVIPELAPCVSSERCESDKYNVYEHIARSVAAYGGYDVCVALALLFHDIGKPLCSATGEDDHAEKSAGIALNIMSRLRFDTATRMNVAGLIKYHTITVSDSEKEIKRMIASMGYEQFIRLMEVKRADILAMPDMERDPHLELCHKAVAAAKEIKDSGACMSRSELAVNGDDLINAGISKGVCVGKTLQIIFDEVINGDLPNERHAILEFVKRLKV